jgi:hypothetical protein
MDSHTLSDYIITQLMDSICNTTTASVAVLHDFFIMEKNKLIDDIKESYTNDELLKLNKSIETYNFLYIIQCLAASRTTQYELERMD